MKNRVALAVVAFSIVCISRTSLAAPFVLTDGDFVSNTYELRYYPRSNTLFTNGVSSSPASHQAAINSLFITNTGNSGNPAWVPGDPFNTGSTRPYLMASGAGGGFGIGPNSVFNTNANATMGWDLSAISGQIAQVELLARNFIFSFDPWRDEANGDQIFAEIATPGAFGAGPFTEMYRHTTTLTSGGMGTNLVDLTGFLSAGWLSNPNLLELNFGYDLVNRDIPGRHLQLFRDDTGTFPDATGFMLRITLAESSSAIPEPSTLVLWSLGAVTLVGFGWRRRKQAA